MPSLHLEYLQKQPLTHETLRQVRVLGEYKGKQDLFRRQTPQLLDSMRKSSVIESTESSNRIEGVVAPRARVLKLILGTDEPRNRSEQEIAGYRTVLASIHENAPNMPLTEGLVRQLHFDLFRFTPEGGGAYKSSDNQITQHHDTGETVIRFAPVPAFATEDAMRTLHLNLSEVLNSGAVDPLLVIPAYILDFLCIHPFRDGNGRLSRLLTLLLLYQSGYEVGRYISLEQIVEEHREGYYASLQASSEGWHTDDHSLQPWWQYFLGTMLLGAFRRFEARADAIAQTSGSKAERVQQAIAALPTQFRVADIERLCPDVSRITISRTLARLRNEGKVEASGPGAGASWRKLR